MTLVDRKFQKRWVQSQFQQVVHREDNMYVPRDEITTIPPGWNEAGSFDFLNDSREDIYSLEDGEEI